MLILVDTKNHDLWLGPMFWACTAGELVSYSQLIRFVRHDSELGQSDGKSVSVGPSQRLRFLTKISAASWDENDALAVQLCWLYTHSGNNLSKLAD